MGLSRCDIATRKESQSGGRELSNVGSVPVLPSKQSAAYATAYGAIAEPYDSEEEVTF